MKKTLLTFCVLALLLCGCASPAAQHGTAPDTVAATAPEIPEGQEAVTEPAQTAAQEQVYLLSQMTKLDENGTALWHRQYRYDTLGRLSSVVETASDGSDSSTVTYTYSADATSREQCGTDAAGNAYTIHETLNEANQVTWSEYIQENIAVSVTTYTYDAMGRLSTEETRYSEDSSVLRIEYSYDEQGNLLDQYQYLDAQLAGWEETSYDADGHRTQICYYDADGMPISNIICTWEGNTEIRSYSGSDSLRAVIITTYDDHGNILREETQQDGDVISCVEYHYESVTISAP